jgi:hypothetical protein
VNSPSDNRIASLRQRVRNASVRTRCVRWTLFVALWLLCITRFCQSGLGSDGSPADGSPVPLLSDLVPLAVVGIFFAAIAAGVAYLLSVVYRGLERFCLALTLNRLTPSVRAQVLMSFVHEERQGDTDTLWRSLLRPGPGKGPAEVTPAAKPPGRGDEPSPAEPER